MQTIVVGCGKVGSLLARLLAEKGTDVAVIDGDPAAFERLGSAFNGSTVKGTGVDTDVLEEAGIQNVDALVAVTSNDNVNIAIAQIAKTVFRVPLVLCRVHDVVKEEIYRRQGMETISPTRLAAQQILRRITVGAAVSEGLPNGFDWQDIPAREPLVGRSVGEAEKLMGGRILFLFRGHQARLATADLVIEPKDTLAVVVPAGAFSSKGARP